MKTIQTTLAISILATIMITASVGVIGIGTQQVSASRPNWCFDDGMNVQCSTSKETCKSNAAVYGDGSYKCYNENSADNNNPNN